MPLTRGGLLAALGVGVGVFLGAGWPGFVALLVFFVTSTLVSRLEPSAARSLLDPKVGPRDAWQVLANGGPAAAGALLVLLLTASNSDLALWIVTASLAAAAADTWATALGSRSPASPRSLLTGRAVQTGTSGGVTILGTFGGVVGATLTAGSAAIMGGVHVTALFTASVIIGLAGMLADSALGAGVQGRFQCPACNQPSEWPRHRCGAMTVSTGGFRWLTNDGVNGLATAFAALLGWGAWAAFARCC